MRIVRTAERLFAYGSRFAIAVQNLGLRNAITVFAAVRGGQDLRSIYVPRLGQKVFFRSAADKGAISHFFYPGTRILDTPELPVRTIVDAGANIGMETVRMRHFHPGASIFAIEPDGSNFVVLQKNATASATNHIDSVQKGLWSSNAFLKVVPGTTNEGFSVRVAGEGESADLEAVTMNDVLERVGGSIDILKMDIEGTEYEVFRENTEWVNHVKAFIFECPDRDHPGASLQIMRTLAHLPFDTYVSGENIVLIRRETGWQVETTPYL